MLHRRHIALRRGIHQVADKEIRNRATFWKERRASLGCCCHALENSILHTPSQADSTFHPPVVWLRWFTHRLSMVCTPIFDGLHTGPQKSLNENKVLATVIHSVTLI